ncbi:MAG: YbhB/YbcL family Raf kinase inhibitor-like protein [Burkholderiales bacterium]|nr:MAG: YbhB/YbcL family Raf kinase inhibitor-like protein [Burkholderiales bacterium]
MKIVSTAFPDHGAIPARHTCEGKDLAPSLAWSDVPQGARGLALIVDDPDAPDPAAPRMTWVHWVLYDMDPGSAGIPEAGRPLPPGTREGLNDWGRAGYGGPCPPVGRHRYFFRLYALDTLLGDLHRPDRAALDRAMRSHIVARAQWVGTYRKGGE